MIRDLGPDANGCPTEEWDVDGQRVIVHYDDVPETDITTVRGVRVTTPLRTAIDLASSLSTSELEDLVSSFMGRDLFTREAARSRLAQPDMRTHPGARVLRAHLGL